MNPSLRPCLVLLLLPTVSACGSVLGYEDDYQLVVAGAPATTAGSGGSGAGGEASRAGAGGATAGAGGAAGATAAGAAGSTAGVGGSAGATAAGAAGSTAGVGGSAGGTTAGAAGSTAGVGGSAGGTTAGAAGSTAGASGSAGETAAGSGGATAGAGGAGGSTTGAGGAAGATAGSGGSSAGAGGASAGAAGAGGSSAGASGSGGTAGGGGAQGGGAGAGGSPNPTDCSVIYVSPNGSSNNDGCAPDRPVSQPSTAFSKAQVNTKEIRLCTGSWTVEPLTIAGPISLRGSFDCTSWTRPDTFGVADVSSVIASSTDAAALTLTGQGVGRSTLVEGLRVQGRSGSAKSRGVLVTTGASPTLRTNHVQARAASGADFPSVGLRVDAGAFPRIEGNLIESGDGSTSADTVATTAVLVTETAGPLELVGNTIRGGKATLNGKGYGSVGVFILPLTTTKLLGVSALVDNVITAGNGNDTAANVELLSTGVFLDTTSAGARSEVAIRGGSISGGNAAHTGTSPDNRFPSAIGVFAGNPISLDLERVRIYAGDASEKTGSSIAVALAGTGNVSIRSSALHGGGASDATPYPRAIESRLQGTLSIAGSTLFTGVPTSVSAGASGGTGLYLDTPGPLALRNNFFVMQAGFAIAIQLAGVCKPSAGSTLLGNGFGQANASQLLYEGDGCASAVRTIADLEGNFSTGAASGNLRLTPDPRDASDTAIACINDLTCMGQILTSYASPDLARSQVLGLTDGSFTPKSCKLGKGGVVVAETPVDLLGAARPATKPSMGALQVAAGICQ